MDPITIAALIAMVAGAGVQYKASTDAAKRAQEETQRSLQRQDDFNRQAEKKALNQAQEFNTDTRQGQQQQIEQQLAQEFSVPAESAQAINAQTATTQGDVSKDYTAAKAASDLNQVKVARNLAGLLAKTTAASRLRDNEAIKMADTASGIDRIGSFAHGTAAADQIAIQNAARPDAGLQLAGGLLSAAGGAGLASAGAAAKGSTAALGGGGGFSGLGTQANGLTVAGGAGMPITQAGAGSSWLAQFNQAMRRGS